MDLLEAYVRDLRENRQFGVRETSSYGTLQHLCDEVGKQLPVRVRCILHPRQGSEGLPDGGFFTGDQFRDATPTDIFAKQRPARGALEVKSTRDDVDTIAHGAQVAGYLREYGLVLVTNYWDFALVGLSAAGTLEVRERYRLAANEAAFWAARPRDLALEHEGQFTEFLKRVLLHNAPITTPENLAFFLASYARQALDRVNRVAMDALAGIRDAMEETLGMTFAGDKGEHFFRSTLVQTIYYGIFSAWVFWSNDSATTEPTFNWQAALHKLHVPAIQELFSNLLTPDQVGLLDLNDLLNHTGATLNRVDRAAFFARFADDHAVQYFYEPFLQAFDPKLRKDLGVWYTPPEVVRYMVERVDTVLREELGKPNGLADPDVYVLDPCCGTGAFLVEVARVIMRTLREQGEDGLLAQSVKEALTHRIFGFEILPAPFVVAHLQLGLLLHQIGAPLSSAATGRQRERAAVYLTNALTGWDAGQPAQRVLPYFPQLQQESRDSTAIKQRTPILVVLGNPPYNAFAGTSPAEEADLVEPYKAGLISEWGIKKFNLDDLYIRFFRLAERRIAEMSGQGVVCFISNFSYLKDASYVVMRQRFLSEFDALWFDSLNGDSRKTGKLTPEGKPDPSIFSTAYNREGIRVGTAIGLLVRKSLRSAQPTVRFRQFWGATKRHDLEASAPTAHLVAAYVSAQPVHANRYSFRPQQIAPHYLEWPKLTDLCEVAPSNGLMEKRGGALMDTDRHALETRMRRYYDASVDWEALRASQIKLTEDAGRFDARLTRDKVLKAEQFSLDHVRHYALRPFDNRWCYYSAVRPLWNEPRPQLWAQCWEGNTFLLSRVSGSKDPEGPPFSYVNGLSDDHFLSPDASAFALRLRPVNKAVSQEQATMFADSPPRANLSPPARSYLAALGMGDPDADQATAEAIWLHALAVGYAPAYLTLNEDGVRQDWPRIPLPSEAAALRAPASLGRQIAALLASDAALPGVTTGSLRAELRGLGNIARFDGAMIAPQQGDLALTAGWGHRSTGPVMPGRGRRVERDYEEAEWEALARGATALGLDEEQTRAALGEQTNDIYLNDRVCWRNVPERVWEYTIGGYQVIKKWLSYREQSVLGRDLTVEEAREVTGMIRRIAGLVLLEPALNANYSAVTAATFLWR